MHRLSRTLVTGTCLVTLFLNLALGGTMSFAETHPSPWFQGTPEQAFQDAKTRGRPLLLYWGAVWCPPCNELKSQVFSKPRFTELTASMVPVYLDGDSESAQAWAETLHVTGYPTVLVLSPAGKELMRVTSSLNMEEFETALTAATLTGHAAQEAVDNALSGKASDDDWRMLAYSPWVSGEGLTLKDAALVQARLKLASTAPSRLKRERSVLAAGALETLAAANTEDTTKALTDSLRSEAVSLLDTIFTDATSIQAARAQIVYQSKEIVGYLFPKDDADRAKAEVRWLKAADLVRQNPESSLDQRLWASFPAVTFLKLKGKDTPIPTALKQAVTKAVAAADQAAKSEYDRKSVVSGAAYMLREVGDFAGARHLLDKELKTTDTPWYYQSSYASLEKAAGRLDEALAWAKKARESVAGRASKLQWIVEDLVLNAKTARPGQEERLQGLVKNYYETALELPDGFQGRNAARAKKVAGELKPWLKQEAFRKLVGEYAGRCGKQASCSDHFAGLLAGA